MASGAWPNRPAALSRGAIVNARSSQSSCGFLSSPVTFSSACNAGRRIMPQAIQAVPHEDAILVDERHDVGHRADRRQSDGPHQKVPHRLADALRLARPLAERPGHLQRHRRAAQAGERIRRRRASPGCTIAAA